MRFGISVLFCAFIIGFAQALKPFYAWSQNTIANIDLKKEIGEQLSAPQVALELKTLLDSDKAFSAVLYMRPTIETDSLAAQITQNFREIHSLIKSTNKKSLERSFPNMEGDIASALSETFPSSVKVNIDS